VCRAPRGAAQREWLDAYWERSDVEIEGDPEAQQAIRWNLFQMAQASARTHEQGIAAKALSAGGYDGHYFWDTEVYVVPFLAATNPEAARKLLRFRFHMLDAARARAREVSQVGALYPWRTINGAEASAYYAAGTAQYHINAAVAYAIERYLVATGDIDFLRHEGAEILVETARLYEDLGFYAVNGAEVFHIHGVTGPDEYTTVVNDNFYTNVMARFTMRFAATLGGVPPRVNTPTPTNRCAPNRRHRRRGGRMASRRDAMYIPYDDELGINPQDDSFLDREPWDFASTADDQYPLLLNFHPLVIYRHQVLKQADVVLAMLLREPTLPDGPEAAELRLLRPDHHRRLVAVGVRPGRRGSRGRVRPTSRSATSSRRSTSTSPTPTPTPPTASTSRTPAVCGPR
jgi:alpha,alpha-trehalose phosphorylase